jgi:hypothetical protein
MQILLVIHSLIRWVILLLLVYNVVNSFYKASSQKAYAAGDAKWNLYLLIFAHVNLVIGLVQYFFGSKGFIFFKEFGAAETMSNPVMRFWAVEHITAMVIAVVIITISRSIAKKGLADGKASVHKKLGFIYLVALIIILAVIPFPFRANFHDYPWFRGF